MSERISKAFVMRRFELFLEDIGGEKAEFNQEAGGWKVGSYSLDHNSVYGGYQVVQMVNPGGAEKTINGARMNAATMVAWFEGVAFATRLFKSR